MCRQPIQQVQAAVSRLSCSGPCALQRRLQHHTLPQRDVCCVATLHAQQLRASHALCAPQRHLTCLLTQSSPCPGWRCLAGASLCTRSGSSRRQAAAAAAVFQLQHATTRPVADRSAQHLSTRAAAVCIRLPGEGCVAGDGDRLRLPDGVGRSNCSTLDTSTAAGCCCEAEGSWTGLQQPALPERVQQPQLQQPVRTI